MNALGKFLASLAPLGRAVLIGLLIALMVLVLVTVQSCQRASVAKTEAKLSTNQAGAAIANGQDAVATGSATGARAAATDRLTQENADAIRNAEGAAAPVAAGARDAGLAGLCRRAAYRRDPRCVQQPPAP